MMRSPVSLSRPARFLLILGTLLLLAAASGVLRADRDVAVSSEEALSIALARVDFVPGRTNVRLIRQGLTSRPVWAVSLSIADPSDDREHERLTTVEVDARTGEVLRVVRLR